MQLLTETIKLNGFGPKNSMFLFLAGDMHCGDNGFHKKGWDYFTKDVNNRENSKVFLLGDPLGFLNWRTGEAADAVARRTAGGKNLFEILNKAALERSESVVELLRPIQSRLCGTIQGNHSWEMKLGDDLISTDEYIAKQLKVPFAEGTIACRFTLQTGGKRASFLPLLYHGSSGGKTETGDQNALIRVYSQYANVDIVAAGHTHHLYVKKLYDRGCFTAGTPMRLRAISGHIARTGSFCKDIKGGKDASYVERKMLPFASLGYTRFQIWLERDTRGLKDVVDVHIEGTAVGIGSGTSTTASELLNERQ